MSDIISLVLIESKLIAIFAYLTIPLSSVNNILRASSVNNNKK